MWTKEGLVAFEDDLAARFERGEIKAPLHLAGGNEEQLIEIFKEVAPQDWVLTTWRSHYHCLLKGVPAEEVRDACLRGRSIALCFPEHRILSSAIVGGIAPIAVGLAMAIKRRGGSERVWCFLGDMAAMAGVVREAMSYAAGHGLPVRWVIENNEVSVMTDTAQVWGHDRPAIVRTYEYKLTRPHVGTGKWVRF